MARLRYKQHPEIERESSKFNTHALSEIDVGDDSAFIKDLDVYVEALGEWKDLNQAFADRDLIPDNYNVHFYEPKTDEDRERGYFL